MSIDTTFLRRRVASLERAMERIDRVRDDDSMRALLRTACVREFELALDQSGKLLRKRLADWFASNKKADRLCFRDLFRHAARHDLLALDAVERWLSYRGNRDLEATGFGEGFADATMELLPSFVEDARTLADVIDGAADG